MTSLERRTIMPRDLRGLMARCCLVPLCLVLLSCQTDRVAGPGEARGDSRALSAWAPGPADSCTPEIHNRYTTVGPDGLRYPTWHPPTDPGSGCTFGHEHG